MINTPFNTYIRSNILTFLIGILCTFSIFFPISVHGVPEEFIIEAFIAITEDDTVYALDGIYDVTFELLTSEDVQVFATINTSIITEGLLTIEVNVGDDIDLDEFSKNILTSQITIDGSDINIANSRLNFSPSSFTGTEVISMPIFSLSNAVQSYSATYADKFSIIDLINIDLDTGYISMATTNNVLGRINVEGTVNATGLIGDGSNLENLSYVRWSQTDSEQIYYTDGNVGIGTSSPNYLLDVTGGTLNILDTLVIADTLESTFAGDAFTGESNDVYNFDASNFTSGTAPTSSLFGIYSNISGLSTVSIGTWVGSNISDAYVKDALSVSDSFLYSPSLKGTLSSLNDTNFISHSYTFDVQSPDWSLSNVASLNSIAIDDMVIESTSLESSTTFNLFVNNNNVITILSDGYIGFNQSLPSAAVHLDSGILIGSSNSESEGLIMFDDGFYGYSDSGWSEIDHSGSFTGYSLFAEDDLNNTIIQVNSSGNTSINSKFFDTFMVSGNIVFLGDPLMDDLYNYESGDYFMWIANKGALRIGYHYFSTLLNPDRVGDYSFSAGINSLASGTGSISVNSPSSSYKNITSGNYSVTVGSSDTTNSNDNALIFSSYSTSDPGENSLIFSSYFASLSGEDSIIFNGVNSANDYDSSYVFGQSSPTAFGDHSFVWDTTSDTETFDEHHYSFYFGEYVGINTNTPNISMAVNGATIADYFIGDATSVYNIGTSNYLNVMIDGETTQVYATHNLAEYYLYISDDEGILPNNSVASASIADASVVSENLDTNIIDSDTIIDSTIDTEDFSTGSIVTDLVEDDSISSSLLSDITGLDFEDDSITDQKLATDSIDTEQFALQAVTTRHITTDQVEGDNIAYNTILNDDLSQESADAYNNEKFAKYAATGRNIDYVALYTTLSDDGTVSESHFIDESIQEQHIAQGAVTSINLVDDSIYSRIIGDQGIDSDDFSTTDNPYVVDDRTATAVVFIGRHFADGAITEPKLADGFLLTSELIASGAVTSADIMDNQILLSHFSDSSIESDHIIDDTITENQLADDSITSPSLAVDSINTFHIVDKSLVTYNFAEGAFTSDKFADATIDSSDLATGSILNRHFNDDFELSEDQIIDQGISWYDFEGASDNVEYFPSANFGSNRLPIKGFELNPEVPGVYLDVGKLATSAITSEDLLIADDSLDYTLLADYLEISAGGTGRGVDFIEDQLLFSATTNTTTQITQNALLAYSNSQSLLYIGSYSALTNTGKTLEALSINGNIFVDGVLITSYNVVSDTYQYLQLDEDSNSLFITSGLALDIDPTSNAGLQVRDLYAYESMSIGVATNKNSLDLASGLSIGTSNFYAILAPTDSLIIEESLQINIEDLDGFNYPMESSSDNFTTYNLYVGGTVYGSSLNIGIIVTENSSADLSGVVIIGSTDSYLPIVAYDSVTGVDASGEMGIVTSGDITAIIATSNTSGKGFHAINDADGVTAAAIMTSIEDDASIGEFYAYMGYSSDSFNAGFYAPSPDITADDYDTYSLYLDGSINFGSLSSSDETPTSEISVDTLYAEGPLIYKPSDASGTIIDWSSNSVYHYTMGSASKSITFSDPELSSRLLMKVEHTGSGTITWPDNVYWNDGYTQELSNASGAIDIVTFIYIAESDIYFGSVAYGFE